MPPPPPLSSAEHCGERAVVLCGTGGHRWHHVQLRRTVVLLKLRGRPGGKCSVFFRGHCEEKCIGVGAAVTVGACVAATAAACVGVAVVVVYS